MKLICVLTIAACMQVSAGSFAQTVSASFNHSPIEKVFKEITRQTGYSFIYQRNQLEQTSPVTLTVKNEQLEQVLRKCFEKQPLTFTIVDKYIVVQTKPVVVTAPVLPTSTAMTVSGKVMNETGEALVGATVTAKKSGIATSTNDKGEFSLSGVQENDLLIFSSIGYVKKEVPVGKGLYYVVKLAIAVEILDETIVIAYGSTTQRNNTGSVSKIKGEEIAKQPVSNPLAALAGRVPGLVVTQTSGVPGSAFNIEIRGRSSLDAALSRNDPLFIIDGVPFEPGNLASNQIVSAVNKPFSTNLGGISPFNTINPMDIESIEVLKDADATAIYGSRGANGVILITTKKGKSGKSKLSVNVNTGWSKVARTMRMLNTTEYLQMRREAFANDGYTAQVTVPFANGYAPDLLILDTTIYTDFKKLLIGNTAQATNAEINFSGGSGNTFFSLGGAYHKETNVFSKALTDQRVSLHFNINHKSADKKFETNFSGFYSAEKNQLIQKDLTQFINLPPNFTLYDSLGKPAWLQKGIPFNYINLGLPGIPSAELLKTYLTKNDNALASLQLVYRIAPQLTFRINAGFNKFITDEVATTPRASLDPSTNQLASSKFGYSTSQSWNIDPQLEYATTLGKGKFNLLLGSTLQDRTTKSSFVNAQNYTSDLLLNSMGAAGILTGTNNSAQYRYTAIFGRLNYNLFSRYIINLSARRDGSSRFGTENRFANFGAIGAAWIFSNESFFKEKIQFISFGKIRASAGITGNDQIGNYKYLDLWNSTTIPYQGIPGLQPGSLFNPNYEWEKTNKLEAALELGLWKDRLLFSVAGYRNRSSNQLINYQLPDQTGFTGVIRNLPALVQNSGVEIVLTSKNISAKSFSWTSSFNITLPKNKLISFPGLSSSSYRTQFKEGLPLNTIYKAKYLGIDPLTGNYMVEDYNRDGLIRFPADYQFLGTTDPGFYGGLQNSFEYKQFSFSFFFEFRKQTGRNFLAYIDRNPPGIALNQPAIIFDRWQKAGDRALIQKFTSRFSGGATANGANYLSNSDGIYSDASFIRLKNIALSYSFSADLLRKLHIETSRVYINAQNLFLITKYKGSDPETQDISVLPPLKTIVAGIHFTF